MIKPPVQNTFFSKNKFLPPVLWKPSLQCLPGLLRLLAILCPPESSTDPEFVSGKWILLRATCAHGHPLQCRSACPMQHSCTSAPSLAPPGSAIAKISVFFITKPTPFSLQRPSTVSGISPPYWSLRTAATSKMYLQNGKKGEIPNLQLTVPSSSRTQRA